MAGALVGRISHSGESWRDAYRFTITNQTDVDWHNCIVRLPDGRSYFMSYLKAREREGIANFRFKEDGKASEAKQGYMTVRCNEGGGYFQFFRE